MNNSLILISCFTLGKLSRRTRHFPKPDDVTINGVANSLGGINGNNIEGTEANYSLLAC